MAWTESWSYGEPATVCMHKATEISRLNIEAGGLSGQLQTARSEGRELSEGVRSVEEEVRTWRRERERESRARVADLQAEAIRLRRELEVYTFFLLS